MLGGRLLLSMHACCTRVLASHSMVVAVVRSDILRSCGGIAAFSLTLRDILPGECVGVVHLQPVTFL